MKSLIILIVAVAAGCHHSSERPQTATMSAAACARTTADGSVVACEPNANVEELLHQRMMAFLEVDRQHPGPRVPELTHLHRVVAISEEQAMTIDSGKSLLLAGVECSINMLQYLRSVFLRDSPDELVYVPSGLIEGPHEFVYAWSVDTDFGAELGDSDFKLGARVTSLNEMGITSEWCKPIVQAYHEYHGRYREISRLP